MKRLIRANESFDKSIPLWRVDEGIVLPVEGSDWQDTLIEQGGKTAARVRRIEEHIRLTYPDVYGIDLDFEPTVGPKGGHTDKYNRPTAFILHYTVYSNDGLGWDELPVDTQFNREWGQVTLKAMLDAFDKEFEFECKEAGIVINRNN